LNVEPLALLKKLIEATQNNQSQIKFLFLNGDKDLQVNSSNLVLFQKLFDEMKYTKFNTKSLPNINHLFQTCKSGAISEYEEIEETLSMEALENVSQFIEKNT